MPTRAALIAGTWVSGALLAASGVITALIMLGDHAYPSVQVLSQAQVRGQLSAQPAVTVTVTPSARPTVDSPSQTPMSPAPAPSPSSTTAPPVQEAAQGFRGGTVFASCSGNEASVTQRIPAQGYGIDRVWPGPSTAAGVQFTSPTRDDLVTITCSGGHPAFASHQEPPGDDEHAGPGQGGGPGRPGGDGQPGMPGGGGHGGPGGPGGGHHGGTGGGMYGTGHGMYGTGHGDSSGGSS